MSKKWIALASLLAIVAAGLLWWSRDTPEKTESAAPHHEPANLAAKRVSRTVTELRVADVDTLVADDRVGNVRL